MAFAPIQSLSNLLRGGVGAVGSATGAVTGAVGSGVGAVAKPFKAPDTFKDDFDKQEGRARLGGGVSGAAQGASQGGAIAGAPGAVLGGAFGALTGQAGAARSATERFQDDRLASLMQRSEDQELGLSAAERQNLIGEQQAASRALTQGQQTDLARQQMASGGFSGQFGELQRQLAGQDVEAGVQAAGVAEEASQNLAQQQRVELQSALAARERREGVAEGEADARAQTNEVLMGKILADDDLRNSLSAALGVDLQNISVEEQAAVADTISTEFDLGGSFDLAQGAGTLGGGI